jgi:hypothetical protein
LCAGAGRYPTHDDFTTLIELRTAADGDALSVDEIRRSVPSLSE